MRVLFLTHRLPYAPNRGDRIRAYHILRLLCQRADVELVSLVHDADEARHADDVRQLGARVTVVAVPRIRNLIRAGAALITTRPLTHVLLDAPGIDARLRLICAERRPDLVLAYCSGMAQFAVKPPLADIPFVLDLVDVDSQKWREMATRAARPMRWVYQREAKRLGAFEAHAARTSAATIVVNEREAGLARQLGPDSRVEVVSNGIDLAVFAPTGAPTTSPRVVFCGVMDYAPNEEAALWLVQEIWPLVRARRADALLRLVGSNPTRRLRAACRADASIEVTGVVPDVRPMLWGSAVAAAPLRIARGLQNKALEALAAGLPTVITSAVAAGLPADALPGCAVADSAEEFAANLLARLALEPADRRAYAARAQLSGLDWSRTLAPLWSILTQSCAEPASATRI
ncbi:MAG TPA: TIGR03087 family PEP-CTERM/XrtA system glycosyltransferase [Vicinamibacterales bacterium]|jgi:sugar transferase (PEP-CTERM/EpsH1 system associated)|nr:TIGR03087 family PEP-CTERM/XrtA system glycosyltransferase [Vicinamibacterales bacterium]